MFLYPRLCLHIATAYTSKGVYSKRKKKLVREKTNSYWKRLKNLISHKILWLVRKCLSSFSLKEMKTSSCTKKTGKIFLFAHSHYFCPRDILTILNWFSNPAVITSPKVHTSCDQLQITARQKSHFTSLTSLSSSLSTEDKSLGGLFLFFSEMLILGGQWSQLSTNISRLRQLLERGSGINNTPEWGTFWKA